MTIWAIFVAAYLTIVEKIIKFQIFLKADCQIRHYSRAALIYCILKVLLMIEYEIEGQYSSFFQVPNKKATKKIEAPQNIHDKKH